MHKLIVLILLFASSQSWGSATRIIDGDALKSPTNGTTVTMPAATGVAMLSVGMVQEAPSGTCNGSTTAFTLANTPGASATVILHLDGLVLTQGAGKDYTISGASITLASACATGQSLWSVYSKY